MPELPQNDPSEQAFKDCTKFHDNRSQIVLKENRSEYQAKNANKKKLMKRYNGDAFKSNSPFTDHI